MTRAAVFSPRLLILWIAAAAALFGGALYLTMRGEAVRVTDAVGPSSFSRSAIGYAGIAELLRLSGVPVVQSQSESLEKLTPGGVLILAEPRLATPREELERLLAGAGSVLLVLPKWQGTPSTSRPGWVSEVALRPLADADELLRLVAAKGAVVRSAARPGWSSNLGSAPRIAAPLQLILSGDLRSLVSAGHDGMLVGEVRGLGDRRVWVLSDPDAIANHALGDPANAAFAVALIDALRRGGNVVFDEEVHGFARPPASALHLLFEFPFSLATAQGALAILLLLWATLGRFGAPEPAPPALGAGKHALMENSVRLLEFAGHQRVIVKRYVEAAIREVAQQLHAPRGMPQEALFLWLRRVGKARGVAVDGADLHRRAGDAAGEARGDPAELVSIVRETHQWKRGILDGG